jgi:tRNA(adenine34) deaminase
MAVMQPSTADDRWMRRCLELAAAAGADGEVPIGAVVVIDGQVAGEGRNRCERRRSPLAHAELEALAGACLHAGAGRIPAATLYCSLEPCFMCAGAALHARVARIVFGARDPKFGACVSLAQLGRDVRLNHRCEVVEGVLAEPSAALLREFFARLRE